MEDREVSEDENHSGGYAGWVFDEEKEGSVGESEENMTIVGLEGDLKRRS